jgi:hypothetical protein
VRNNSSFSPVEDLKLISCVSSEEVETLIVATYIDQSSIAFKLKFTHEANTAARLTITKRSR